MDHASARRRDILRLLVDRGTLRVADLATHFGVSEPTIRTDLGILDRRGALVRVHGGAVPRQEPGQGARFTDRLRRNAPLKRWIAQRAAAMVDDGDSIFLDAATTTFGMVHGLQDRSDLTIFTNGLDVARAAADNPTSTVVLLGGILRPGRSSVVGQIGSAIVQDLRFHKAFVSCSAFSFESGLMEDNLEEAQLKLLVVKAADQVIALVDSSKLAGRALTSFASVDAINQLLIDEHAAPEHIARLREREVPVTICGDRHVTVAAPDGHSERRYRIGFANLTEEIEFAVAVRRGVERAAARAGNVDLLIADNGMDGPTALRNVEYFIEAGVDLVIEYQYHASYGEVIMARFREAGIPVVAVDIPMPGATYFGVDNYLAGRIGGTAAGRAVRDRWASSVDRVISLELPGSGGTPHARMQGQLDALSESVQIRPDQVIHLDSRASERDARRAVADILPTIPHASRLVVLACNDEVAIGAIHAFREAGRESQAIVVSQGADAVARSAMLEPGSPLVGAVSYTPEQYGHRLIPLALAILSGRPVPPAIFLEHSLVTPESVRTAHDGAPRGGRGKDEPQRPAITAASAPSGDRQLP